MPMEKILELNKSPRLTSYVHHSYTNSIIDRTSIASLFVNDLCNLSWNMDEVDVEYACDMEKNLICISERQGRVSTSFKLWRSCQSKDEVIVKLQDIKLLDSLSNIRLEIRDREATEDEEASFWFYWNQYDMTMEKGHISYPNHFKKYYKLHRENDEVKICVSSNLKKWDVVYERVTALSELKDPIITVTIYYGYNQYEQWVQMNYVQLFYNIKDRNTVYLDYYMFPRKGSDASYQYLCHFLDTEYIECQPNKCVEGIPLCQYLKNSIFNDYYVNVCLNEYYIERRGAYKAFDYEHYNLIYGYSDKEKLFYLLGYNSNGKLEISTLPFKLLEKSLSGSTLVRYKYNVNNCKYGFKLFFLKELLLEFINGSNSSRRYAGLLENREGVYGIKVFDQLCNSEDGRRIIIEDRRMSFLLYEHCKLMQSRLRFLDKSGYLKPHCQAELSEKCECMVKTSEILKNLVIKNIMHPRFKDNIFEQLIRLKKYELDFVQSLVSNLIESD